MKNEKSRHTTVKFDILPASSLKDDSRPAPHARLTDHRDAVQVRRAWGRNGVESGELARSPSSGRIDPGHGGALHSRLIILAAVALLESVGRHGDRGSAR